MYDHRNLLGRQIEQATGFDDLESLIHQGGRVNGDAVAHFPGGMVQRLSHRNIGKVGFRSIQEWPAGSREPDAADFLHPASAKTLVDCVMLAVDREQSLPLAAGLRGY